MRPETRYAIGAEGAIGYQVVGEGPDLIFIPNWLSNIDVMWEEPSYGRFLDRLASFSRLICFDKRGSGISEAVPATALPTLEQWMDDILLVMETVGTDNAALLGWDIGGLLAMLFAASYPERTSHLILVDAWAALKRDDDYPIGVPEEAMEAFIATQESAWGRTDGLTYLSLAAPEASEEPHFREWFARYQRLARTPVFAAAISRATFDWDLRPILPSIRTPTLVMSHQNQSYVRPELGRFVAGQINAARYVDLAGPDTLIYRSDTETLLSEVKGFMTGVREVPDFDRVLATILFTDIVGSTDLAAKLGDRHWRQVLDQHDVIVRERVAVFRGRVVKTTGDGFLVTFDGPARAIRCAMDISESVRSIGLEVRAGLHTGELELRDDNIGGIAVHLAARVMAIAEPNQVLVSRTVKDLVAGSGLGFDDAGTHSLKGVPGEWQLFRLAQA